MDYVTEFLKIYGPLGLGWPIALYLGKNLIDRNKDDIEARVKLAVALDALTKIIEGLGKNG